MSLDRLGIKLDPGKLNKKLTEVNGFTNRGWLIWSKIPEVTSDAVTITLSNSPTYHEIDDALKNGYSIITKIKLKERVTHWVLITGKNGSDYLVKDPLNQAKKLNKISDLSKQIYATRIIRN
ncbi:MAG: hypothetical protein NE334_01130 [Lentisphaeraceae bacterium]|nr:hypothetical protein [Lentisphaeraceae bacterium]